MPMFLLRAFIETHARMPLLTIRAWSPCCHSSAPSSISLRGVK